MSGGFEFKLSLSWLTRPQLAARGQHPRAWALQVARVSLRMQVSLAIVDPCPVTPNLQLPPFYEAPVRCGPHSLGCCNECEAFAATACAAVRLQHVANNSFGLPVCSLQPATQAAAGAVPAGEQPLHPALGPGHLQPLLCHHAAAGRRGPGPLPEVRAGAHTDARAGAVLMGMALMSLCLWAVVGVHHAAHSQGRPGPLSR